MKMLQNFLQPIHLPSRLWKSEGFRTGPTVAILTALLGTLMNSVACDTPCVIDSDGDGAITQQELEEFNQLSGGTEPDLGTLLGLVGCQSYFNSGGPGSSGPIILHSDLTRSMSFEIGEQNYSFDNAALSAPCGGCSGNHSVFVAGPGVRASIALFAPRESPKFTLSLYVRGFRESEGITQTLVLDLSTPESAEFVGLEFVVDGPQSDIVGAPPSDAVYSSNILDESLETPMGTVEIRFFTPAPFPSGFTSNVINYNIDIRLVNVRLPLFRTSGDDIATPESVLISSAQIVGFLNPNLQ